MPLLSSQLWSCRSSLGPVTPWEGLQARAQQTCTPGLGGATLVTGAGISLQPRGKQGLGIEKGCPRACDGPFLPRGAARWGSESCRCLCVCP